MPTYCHECTDENCKFEWEDYYSIVKDPPTVCPKCNQETARRVISGGSGKGIVELTGHDLVSKTKEDIAKLKDMHKDSNLYANLMGESKYHDLQTRMDRRGK